MKKYISLLIIGLLVSVVGCKKEKKMSGEEASEISNAVMTGIVTQSTSWINPDGFTVSPAKSKGDTVIVSGDTTDADTDCVTVSGRWEFHYEDTLFGGYLFDGVVQHDDAGTDNDPFTWHVTIGDGDYFKYEFGQLSWAYKGDLSATYTNDTYTLDIDYYFKIQADAVSCSIHYDIAYTYTSDESSWQPGEEPTSGDITIDGNTSYSNDESYDLTIETLEALHFTASNPLFNDGKIKLTDSEGNVIEITINSDGSYTIKVNGKPV